MIEPNFLGIMNHFKKLMKVALDPLPREKILCTFKDKLKLLPPVLEFSQNC